MTSYWIWFNKTNQRFSIFYRFHFQWWLDLFLSKNNILQLSNREYSSSYCSISSALQSIFWHVCWNDPFCESRDVSGHGWEGWTWAINHKLDPYLRFKNTVLDLPRSRSWQQQLLALKLWLDFEKVIFFVMVSEKKCQEISKLPAPFSLHTDMDWTEPKERLLFMLWLSARFCSVWEYFLLCSSVTSVYLYDLVADSQVSRRAGMHTKPYPRAGDCWSGCFITWLWLPKILSLFWILQLEFTPK